MTLVVIVIRIVHKHCHNSVNHIVISLIIGWHYLSNATCLMRPHAFCVFHPASAAGLLRVAAILTGTISDIGPRTCDH